MSGISWQQRVSLILARYGQKPVLALPFPQPVARALFNLNARIVYKTPRDLTLRADRIGGVPGVWAGRRGQAKNGVLLFLHGGAFVLGSVRSYRHLVAALAAEAGLEGFLADYRLAPEHPFPAALDDALAAYRGLLAAGHAPDRIALAGDSAGGGLVLSLLHVLGRDGLPMPAVAGVMSPITDMTFSGASITGNLKRDPLIPVKWGYRGVMEYLNGHDPDDPRVSPLFGDFSSAPPVMIQACETEVLRDDGVRMADLLRRAGREVVLDIWPRVPHVWHLMAGRVPEADRAIAELGGFLSRHIARETGDSREREGPEKPQPA
ncbi:alpha/beta hydrolase [Rhodophyticola porphyridii]|uniref:Alpha/beta hydrolase n=1 Tax=Rhodophyticola porphyridii TaxID=1852017 RepID=A0A3L9Y494_9RHOB|nr:alpha/beta hydrolase [Rhodophyticola porphyridii]RMA42148.1 alpha/beta hydrolase [Rhodophyticola porphyridii]